MITAQHTSLTQKSSGIADSLLKLVLVVLISGLGLSACDNTTPAQHLDEAKARVGEGELDSAIIELKNAIQKDRSYASARALLGSIRLQQGEPQLAHEDLSTALDLGDEQTSTEVNLYRAKHELGLYNEIIGALEDKTVSNDMAVILGRAYLGVDDLDAAKPVLVKGLDTYYGLLGMSELAYLERDLKRSHNYVKKAVELDGDSPEAWLFKGEVELALGLAADAAQSYQMAQKHPGGLLGGKLGEVRAQLANDKLDSALRVVNELIAAVKNFTQAHYLKGLVLFRQGEFEKAQDALFEAEKRDREHLATMHLMAAVKFQLQDYEQAEFRLKNYLNRDAGNVSARKLLATIASQQGRWEEVVALLEPISLQQSDPQLWAMLGNALLRKGDSQAATQALESAVALAPDMAAFRNQLAISLLSVGDDQRAKTELANAIEIDGDQFQSDYLLAMVKVREGDFQGARSVVDSLIARSPDSPIGDQLLGGIAMAQKQIEPAQAHFRSALEKDALYFPAAQSLAAIARNQGDLVGAQSVFAPLAQAGSEKAQLAIVDLQVAQGMFDQALTSLEHATTTHPESIIAKLGHSRLLMAMGKFEEAAVVVNEALTLSAQEPDILLVQAELLLRQNKRDKSKEVLKSLDKIAEATALNNRILQSLGTLHLSAENLTSARKYFNQVQRSTAQDDPNLLLQFAKLEFGDKNLSAAQNYLKKLVDAGINNEEVGLLQGRIHQAGGQSEAAISQYKHMAENGSPVAASRAVMVMLASQQNTQAKAFAEQWMEGHPQDKMMQGLLATALTQLGDKNAAKAQYEQMLPSSDPVVLNNLAWIYMEEGNPDALRLAQKANQVSPGNPDIEDTLGWILVKEGRYEEGLEYLVSSSRARPDNAAVQYHLGMAYKHSGDARRAVRALRRAVKIGNFDDLEAAQSELDALES